MPEDPFAQLRGPYGETFRDGVEEDEASGWDYDQGPTVEDGPTADGFAGGDERFLVLTFADRIADLVDKGVDREGTHFHLQHDDRQKLLELVKARRAEKES